MAISVFARILHEMKILGREDSVRGLISENFLKVERSRVYFQTETEISEPTPAEQIEKFFSEHVAEIIKIFVKHNSQLYEIPFVDGMPFDLFGKFLRERKIIGNATSPEQLAKNSLLKVVDGKIFLFSDEEQVSVDEYFNFHADDIKKILIKHAQKTFELPFVNGITLEMFGKLLREKNIIGKSTSATSVAKKNFLDVRNGKVFLCDEERLVELYAEATGDFAAYFDQHTAKNIFVKHNGNLFEIPFADGMSLALFDKILREKKIIGRNSSGKKIAAQSLLDVRNKRVFLLTEDELSIAQDDLETDVDGFFNEHALEIKSISIRHDGKIFDLPFVNGMPLKVFGKLLRERKIIDRKISAKEIIVSNRLELRNEKIFIRELI